MSYEYVKAPLTYTVWWLNHLICVESLPKEILRYSKNKGESDKCMEKNTFNENNHWLLGLAVEISINTPFKW